MFSSFTNAIMQTQIFGSDKIALSRYLVEESFYGAQQEIENVEVNIFLAYRIHIDLGVKSAIFFRKVMCCAQKLLLSRATLSYQPGANQ